MTPIEAILSFFLAAVPMALPGRPYETCSPAKPIGQLLQQCIKPVLLKLFAIPCYQRDEYPHEVSSASEQGTSPLERDARLKNIARWHTAASAEKSRGRLSCRGSRIRLNNKKAARRQLF